MTVEEVQKAIEALKAQGMDEEEILAAFYAMYCDDKITAEQLEGLTMAMGYEFTEEFKNMSDEDKKHFGEDADPDAADDKPAEGVTKEEVEDAKQYDVPDDKKEETPEEEKKEEEVKEPEESEEDRAKKLFGLK